MTPRQISSICEKIKYYKLEATIMRSDTNVRQHSRKIPQAQLSKLLHKFLQTDKSQAFPLSGEVYYVV